jgi:choline dehydrogenase-like flavoprotein
MRYVIVGAGALGGCIGAKLAASGQDVALVARGAHLAALQVRWSAGHPNIYIYLYIYARPVGTKCYTTPRLLLRGPVLLRLLTENCMFCV